MALITSLISGAVAGYMSVKMEEKSTKSKISWYIFVMFYGAGMLTQLITNFLI